MFVGLTALLFLIGCTSRTTNIVANPETRAAKFTVDMPFDTAFSHAIQSFAVLGGGITSQDSRAGTISATVHNALTMTVTLNRVSETKTEVNVWGSTLPGKMIVGVFTEVDDYQRIFQSGK